ncbi:unnamed protein product, partial [Meganyctiphanes norvegica]
VAIVLFACVAAVSAQGFFNPFAAFFRRPQRPQPPQQQFRPQPPQQQQFRPQPQQSSGVSNADDTFGGSSYHYSWRHDGNQKYTGGQAAGYCRGIGWKPVSIESAQENNFITRVIQGEQLDYIWTGATKSGFGWSWPSGAGFSGINWSHTGGAGQSQPDNREQGGENCMAILNNFYNDGVKWHDVACHHLKPVICEQ